MSLDAPMTCWVLSEGKAGMERQCIGLAEAVGLPYTVKRVKPHWLWKDLPAFLRPDPRRTLGPGSSPIEPPWPGLLIACGRQSIPFAHAIKRWSEGHTFLVQTQNPRGDLAGYDLVVPPNHDQVSGPNVFSIVGSPHPITTERLARAKKTFADKFAPLPAPRVAVLIGGNSKAYKLTPARAQQTSAQLRALAEDRVSLMITMSRRTREKEAAIIKEALAGTNAFIWDGTPSNPYEGILAWADAILVTADSVNMMTEAAATGRPVFVLQLDGGSPKFDRFHAELTALGITRPFRGKLEFWTYEPLHETQRVAAEIRRHLGLEAPLPARAGVTAARLLAPPPSLSKIDHY
ncbi:MAG: mitochondrial fission ELM1 family protein [Alphaproteobacteria bacterium]|nr:mitochondrial fission ELM1 family protein [Alphaproteobacteria bacterium]